MSLPTDSLSPQQRALVMRPLAGRTWLEGPAGCGKTTAGVQRLLRLLESGVRADTILVMAPQRTLLAPYYDALQSPEAGAGSQAQVLTLGGLAKRSLELFFPLIAEGAGFARPDEPPVFLTMETAQYYMARVVEPLLAQGYFDSVAIDPNRLFAQILDNLNKAAVVGFDHLEIGQRLKSAAGGEIGQMRVYDDVQECAARFRRLCLENNLLDYSLQIETFIRCLWRSEWARGYLRETCRHLIFDNLEEDTPVAHDLLLEWLPDFDTALLITDRDAGYRRFLGADPLNAARLAECCDDCVTFEHSFVTPPALEGFAALLGESLQQPVAKPPVEISAIQAVTPFGIEHYYPQLLDWVAGQARALVDSGVPAGEIAILSPYLSDALRFSITHRLNEEGIPTFTHRPSRSLRDEPATHCLLTLAGLANPDWGLLPSRADLAFTLNQGISGMDAVRAQLLAEIVYQRRQGQVTLTSFDIIKPEMQARITYDLGNRYERLRLWLEAYRADPQPEPDLFFSRLFGEVLSQPGYGFHRNHDAGEQAARLVESARKFRQVTSAQDGLDVPLGREYLAMVRDGVVAAQYLSAWRDNPADAVQVAPAYTFLMSNRAVRFQFWLDISSSGWWQRLDQPLTHPYVLSRSWQPGAPWTDEQEYQTNQAALYRLALGLARRCRDKVYLAIGELNEQGYQQQGPLLRAFQSVVRRFPREDEDGANGL